MEKAGSWPHTEFDYRKGILEAIVYFSGADGDKRLPTCHNVMHREICDAIVEYLTGKESTYEPSGYNLPSGEGPDGKTKYTWHPGLQTERDMWDYLQEAIAKSGDKLNPRVKEALATMLKPKWKTDETGDGEYDYGLSDIFYSSIIGPINRPTSLQTETAQYVQSKVVPSLSAQERTDVEGIGKSMRKYIVRDAHCW